MIILLEGVDGVGKTSLAQFLKYEIIRETGVVPLLKKEPHGIFREALFSGDYGALTNLFLLMSSRSDLTSWLNAHTDQVVILDRFSPSTLAYQNFPPQQLLALDAMARNNVKPDYSFLLTATSETFEHRLKEKGERHTTEQLQELEQIALKYAKAFELLNWDYKEIKTDNRSLEAIAKEVYANVKIV